jgi:hypothetical protein
VTGLSDLMTLFLTWGVYIAKSIQCFQKHAKLIENRFSRSKVQLTSVGTSHKTMERLALRESLRFHSWR